MEFKKRAENKLLWQTLTLPRMDIGDGSSSDKYRDNKSKNEIVSGAASWSAPLRLQCAIGNAERQTPAIR